MNSNNNDANVSHKRRHKKLRIDVINPKYKSNLNKDNDKSVDVDNSKNNNNNKKSVFIVEESIVKNINGFLIMKANNHKCIVTAWPFSSTKLYCT